jgi:hypothetical protein
LRHDVPDLFVWNSLFQSQVLQQFPFSYDAGYYFTICDYEVAYAFANHYLYGVNKIRAGVHCYHGRAHEITDLQRTRFTSQFHALFASAFYLRKKNALHCNKVLEII